MSLPCGDVVTTVKDYLADVIANVVVVVIATLFDFVATTSAIGNNISQTTTY